MDEHLARNERMWDRRAEDFDARRFDYFRILQRRVLSLMPLRKGITFLDVGCGTGRAVLEAHRRLEGEGSFHGIDLSPGMIERASENAAGLTGVDFTVADAEHLPFDDASIDLIVCTNSFHHYPRPVSSLRQFSRVLTRGGAAYILDVTADLFLIRWIDARTRAKEPEHVRFYSTLEFKEMLGQAGLSYAGRKVVAFPEILHIGRKP